MNEFATRNRLMGLGDFSFKAAIADAAAGGDLDKLRSALFKFHDALSGAYAKLDALEKWKRELDATAQLPGMMVEVAGARIPSEAMHEVSRGYAAVTEGYKSLVAFHFVAGAVIETLNTSADALRPIFDGIDGLTRAYYNWNDTMGKRVWPLGYTGEFFQKLQADKWRYWVSDTARTDGYDYSDIRYVQSAKKAVEAALGLEVSREEAGLGELVTGVVVIIVAIAAVVVVIALVAGIILVMKEFNVKAKSLHEQRMAYEASMEAQRKAYFDQRQAEGADAATIQREWQGVKDAEDKAQAAKEKEYAATSDAGSAFGSLASVAALGIGAFLLIQLVPMLKGRSS